MEDITKKNGWSISFDLKKAIMPAKLTPFVDHLADINERYNNTNVQIWYKMGGVISDNSRPIAANPFQLVYPNYNKFYQHKLSTSMAPTLTFNSWNDVISNMSIILNRTSYLYTNRIHDYNEHNVYDWTNLTQMFYCFYNEVGYDKPFWTSFLPENITHFVGVYEIDKCIVAKSTNYVYVFKRD